MFIMFQMNLCFSCCCCSQSSKFPIVRRIFFFDACAQPAPKNGKNKLQPNTSHFKIYYQHFINGNVCFVQTKKFRDMRASKWFIMVEFSRIQNVVHLAVPFGMIFVSVKGYFTFFPCFRARSHNPQPLINALTGIWKSKMLWMF